MCRILEAKQSCELNPSKIESPTEACANAEFLLQAILQSLSLLDNDEKHRCWMTLQNPSSCQARPVPAHCAIFVLVCREMSRTGAETNIFGFCLNTLTQVASRETCENSGSLWLHIPSPSLSCNTQSKTGVEKVLFLRPTALRPKNKLGYYFENIHSNFGQLLSLFSLQPCDTIIILLTLEFCQSLCSLGFSLSLFLHRQCAPLL